MHIAEGVLAAPVLIAGGAGAACALAWGLRRLDADRMMTGALAGAVFFVASLIHVPVGISSAHLIMNGLAGVLLGWAAVPVIFVALLLQSLLLGFGGLTVIGVNTLTMGLAAVAAGGVFRLVWKGPQDSRARLSAAAFAAGTLGVGIAALLTALALAFSDEGFAAAGAALFAANLPIMVAEGIISIFIFQAIARINPRLLEPSEGFLK